VNNIEILPPSPMDDQLRRAIYPRHLWDAALSRYSIQAVAIHPYHREGCNVTLEGVVITKPIKTLRTFVPTGSQCIFGEEQSRCRRRR